MPTKATGDMDTNGMGTAGSNQFFRMLLGDDAPQEQVSPVAAAATNAIRMDFDNGKYTAIYDNGRLSALRHGEPWRTLTGDNLFYWMLVTAAAQQEREKLLTALLKEAQSKLKLLNYPASKDLNCRIGEALNKPD